MRAQKTGRYSCNTVTGNNKKEIMYKIIPMKAEEGKEKAASR